MPFPRLFTELNTVTQTSLKDEAYVNKITKRFGRKQPVLYKFSFI